MAESRRTAVLGNGVIADLSGETLRLPDGAAVALRPQTFATLRYLIDNANRLVSKAELFEAVWGGLAVTDDSLVQCVHEIRRALGDDGHKLLQTVSRRGYRLNLKETAAGPSIAVLPFAAPEGGGPFLDGPFLDGLVDDVITGLARVPGFFVTARNSSFAYRGQPIDARRIAAELGVRYLLEGSLREGGDRLRLNARLIDGATAGCVWAGSFEGDRGELFELQDRLTEQIVGVIEPSVRRAEMERARRKPPESLDAYDRYLRALPHVMSNALGATDVALGLLDAALALDPDFLPAHGYAAWCREQRYMRGGFDPADRAAALDHARVVMSATATDPLAMSMGAFVRSNLTRDYDGAIDVLDRALALNPNSALAYGFSALVAAHSERDARAVAHAGRALRLSPLDDPMSYHPYCALAVTSLFSGRLDEAVGYARLTIRSNPDFTVPYAYLVAAHVGLGDEASARAAARRLLAVAPAFTAGGFARMDNFRAPLTERIVGALLRIGIPG
ncbi:MAG TPA: winged helix-turn-helix domain-containing protein [Amaricoccus sp.]|nr:winged helix-turn-helix domain-containing protein [Amaricoccus sp.]